MRVLRFIGRAILELGRGLGLILRDIHRALYRRLRARLWWIYLGVAFVVLLWLTGQFWNLILQVLTFILIFGLLWLAGKNILRAIFGGGRERRRER